MIYGNKFLNYGINLSNVLEIDMTNFDNIVKEFCIDESTVVTEAVNIKEAISKAFEKIKGFFIKALEIVDKIINFVHEKLDGFITKLIQALQKQKGTVGESAEILSESDESGNEVVVYSLSSEGLSYISAYRTIMIDLANKLSNFIVNMQKKNEELINQKIDNASARDILGKDIDEFYEKFNKRYEECEDIIYFIQESDKNKIFNQKEYTINLKSEKEINSVIDDIKYAKDEIKKYVTEYKEFRGFIETIKKTYFDPVENVYNSMSISASNTKAQKEYQKDMDIDKKEFDFQYKYISVLYSYTSKFYSITSKGINATIKVLTTSLTSNAKLIRTVGTVPKIKAVIGVEAPEINININAKDNK